MSAPTEQLLRVQNFKLSTDGYGSGEGPSLDRPFGHADPAALASWSGATAHWPNRTDPGGTCGLDDYCTRDFTNNIGAEIMGRGKFGPQKGPWKDHEWQGWWGDAPPFHTPVFVLTHHARPTISLSDTTFHFIDASQRTPCARRRPPPTARTCASAAACPPSASSSMQTSSTRCTSPSRPSSSTAAAGSGTHPMNLLDRFHHEPIPSPSGITHHLLWRR